MNNIFAETVRRIGLRLRLGTASLHYEKLENAITEEMPQTHLSFDKKMVLTRKIAHYVRTHHIPRPQPNYSHYDRMLIRHKIYNCFKELKSSNADLSYRQAAILLKQLHGQTTSKSSLERIVREFAEHADEACTTLDDAAAPDLIKACRLVVEPGKYVVTRADYLVEYLSSTAEDISHEELDRLFFNISCALRTELRLVRLGDHCCISRRGEPRAEMEMRIIRAFRVRHIRGFPRKADIDNCSSEVDILFFALYRIHRQKEDQFDLELVAKYLIPPDERNRISWCITRSCNSSDFMRYAGRIAEDTLDARIKSGLEDVLDLILQLRESRRCTKAALALYLADAFVTVRQRSHGETTDVRAAMEKAALQSALGRACATAGVASEDIEALMAKV